jgi:hypothetical protein
MTDFNSKALVDRIAVITQWAAATRQPVQPHTPPSTTDGDGPPSAAKPAKKKRKVAKDPRSTPRPSAHQQALLHTLGPAPPVAGPSASADASTTLASATPAPPPASPVDLPAPLTPPHPPGPVVDRPGLMTLPDFLSARDRFAASLKASARSKFLASVTQLLDIPNPRPHISPFRLTFFLESEICKGNTPSPAICRFFSSAFPQQIPADYMAQQNLKANRQFEDRVHAVAEYAQACLDPQGSLPSSPVLPTYIAPLPPFTTLNPDCHCGWACPPGKACAS